MNEIINSILISVVLIPGFLCVYLPYKIFAIKHRFSNLELTLLSLIMSIIIFSFSLVIYQIIYFFASPVIRSLELIELSELTILQLIENPLYIIIFILTIILFFYIGLFFLSKDRLRGLRKRIGGVDTIISPYEYVWTVSLQKHKENTNGYGLVETNDKKIFRGFIKRWTRDTDKNELLLKHPEIMDDAENKYIPVMGVESILFLNDDIKRIYLLSPHENNNHNEENNEK